MTLYFGSHLIEEPPNICVPNGALFEIIWSGAVCWW